MVQWDWRCLCSGRTQVRSLAGHSGLKDPEMLQLWCRSQLSLGSDPWPGNPIGRRAARKEKKKIPHISTCLPKSDLIILFFLLCLLSFGDRTHGIWRFPG